MNRWRFETALENAERFFMKTGQVHQAALAIARCLDAANIPYAIAGAMALNAHGYRRVTTDVDVLLTRNSKCPAEAPAITLKSTLKTTGG